MKVFFHNVVDLFKDLNRVGCLHFVVSPLFFIKLAKPVPELFLQAILFLNNSYINRLGRSL
jgi:hypothetical protein